MKAFKFLLWGGLALTVLLAGSSAARAANAARNLEYSVLPRFAGLDPTGLKIDLDASFVNDTAGQVTARDTVVELRHGDTLLGKVDLTGRTIRLKPKSRGKLSDPDQLGGPVRVHVPYEFVARYVPQALSAFLGFGPPLKLDILVRTRVKIPWVPELPVSYSESYTLEKPA